MENNKKIYLTLIITAIVLIMIAFVIIYQNLQIKDSLNKSYLINETLSIKY